MIQNFGQVPCQLLKEPHPPRITFTDYRAKMMKEDYKRPDILKYPSHWRPYCVDLGSDKNPLVFIQHPAAQVKSLLQYGTADSLVSISSDGTVGHHNWLPYDRNLSNHFYFDKDPSWANVKLRRKLPGPFIRNVILKSKVFAVTPDAKFIIYGGAWDSSVRVYSLAKAREVASSVRHTDLVTAVAMDRDGALFISGSADTTATVWEVTTDPRVPGDIIGVRSVGVLCGHEASVTSVAISVCLDLAVTGSR